jgi:hypothetical protein
MKTSSSRAFIWTNVAVPGWSDGWWLLAGLRPKRPTTRGARLRDLSPLRTGVAGSGPDGGCRQQQSRETKGKRQSGKRKQPVQEQPAEPPQQRRRSDDVRAVPLVCSFSSSRSLCRSLRHRLLGRSPSAFRALLELTPARNLADGWPTYFAPFTGTIEMLHANKIPSW